MAGGVGIGNLTFGSTGLTYRSEDGLSEDGPTVPEVNCTAFGETDEKYASGDVVDFGTVSATVICDHTIDVDALVSTTETLTVTYPITVTGNTSAATKSGEAFLVSAPVESNKNDLNVRTVTFRWTAKPTFAAESA